MTRKRMNPGLQKWQIGRMLSGTRVSSEVFDIHAHMDRSLHLDENIRNIRQLTGQERPGYRQRYAPARRATRAESNPHYQVGTSNYESDRLRRAKIPGTRYGPSGRYVERRKNRSDRPGHST